MFLLIRQRWPWLGLCVLMLVTWLAYRPGLTGGFLFDDFVNLDALGNSGPIVNAPALWRYLTSGIADPTGRPLALLSFLIDGRNWPADPAPFLRTNLILHLLNGGLLFALLRQLGRVLCDPDFRNECAALLAAGLWLLHPLFVSTTLYIVQREAMLPVSFMLLGLLAYGYGRNAYAASGRGQGLCWMVAGIGLGTVLATLCKANGILLPLLALVLEVCIYQRLPLCGSDTARQSRTLQRSRFVLLVLPSVLVLGYVGRYLLLLGQNMGRPWTIGQRLLTEPRVLLDYLQLLLVPRSISTGLFNDDYPVAHSFWQPLTTLPAILLIVGLAVLAFRLRHRSPALAAALLFFFAGHVLESTAVPLELYFEHRNYLPALLLFWPLARALAGLDLRPAIRFAIALGCLALFAATTWQRATIWGQPELLSSLWGRQNPDSSRAQAAAAIELQNAGRPQLAMARLTPLWRQRPYDLQIALNYVNAACAWRGLSAEDTAAMSEAFRHADGALLVRQWLDRAIETAASGRCQGMDLAVVKTWLTAAMANPEINNPRTRDKSMASLYAQIAIREQQPEVALAYFNRALAANISPEVAGGQTALLAANGYYRQALAHLDYYDSLKQRAVVPGFGMRRLHAWVLDRQDYWPHELALLRSKLVLEIAAGNTAPARQPNSNRP